MSEIVVLDTHIWFWLITKDPFDRLIIATTLVYEAKLASVDNLFTLYSEIGDRLLSS